MKKTQFIDAIKNIKNRWPSFLSVVLIISLGTGGFFGMHSIVNGLREKGISYFENTNLKDYDLVSNVGVVEEDLNRISKIVGVDKVEGVINLTGALTYKDLEFNTNIVSLTKDISVPVLVDGNLPKAIDECAINEDLAKEANIKVGDQISLISSLEGDKNPLKKHNYKVAGIIIHPEYVRSRLTWSVVLPLESFDLEALNNSYTDAYVSLKRNENANSFTNEYYEETKETNDELWNYIDELDSSSKKRIVRQSEEEISKQLDKLYELLNKSKGEIDDNEYLLNSELYNAKKQIADARKQLADAYRQIEDGQRELEEGEKQLNQARQIFKELDDLYKKLNKDSIIEYLRQADNYIDEYQKALENGDNKRIEEIKKEIDDYLNNDNVKIITKIISSVSGIDPNELINNIKAGSGLDNIKPLIDKTIIYVEENGDSFNNLTSEEIISYIDEANNLLEELKKAIDNNNISSTKIAKKAIEDFLNQDDTSITFIIIEALTGQDIKEIMDNASKFTIDHNIDIIINNLEEIKNSSFLDLFEKENIEKFIDRAFVLINNYKDALASGIDENIENAKKALEDFLNEKSSVVIGRLIKQYTGKDLDNILDIILSNNSIDTYLPLFDFAIDSLASDEILDKISKDNLISIVRQVGVLAEDYKNALLNNQEDINNAKESFNNFVSKEEVQLAFNIIKMINPEYDLNSYIPLVENIDFILRFIDLNNIVEDYIENNEDKFNIVDKEDIVSTLNELKDNVHLYSDIIKFIIPGDKEEVKQAIDNIINKDNFELIKMLIEFKTGFSLDSFIESIKADSFLELGVYLLRLSADELINSEAFNSKMSKEAVSGYIDNIEDLLKQLKKAVEEKRLDLIEEIKNNLDNILENENVKFFIDLAKYYFGFDLDYFIDLNGNKINNIQAKLNEIKEAIKAYDYLKIQIAEGETKLRDGRAQLDAALKEYLNGKNLLDAKEKEMLEKEADARDQLSEARNLLSEEEGKALDEIEKIRKEVDSKEYHWVIQGRDANPSFVEYRAAIASVNSSNTVFGSFFLLISSLVCFSTIAIIVEEDKKSVGTTKAFGFYGREVFNKYLLFALLASLLGNGIGAIFGALLSRVVLDNMTSTYMYTIGKYPLKMNIPIILITTLVVSIICVLATLIACSDLLRSPAALLMKGDTIASRDRKLRNKNISGNTSGSLYSRLIVRNMINDKERVLISILIVAASCFVMGGGFSLRNAFYSMFDRQASEVMKYDIRVDYGNLDKEYKNNLIDVLNKYNASYVDVKYGANLYEHNRNISGLYLLTTSDENIYDYINILDNKTRKKLDIPKEGILIQGKMKESYGINVGDTLTILDNNSFGRHDTKVMNNFLNYQGRLVVMSNEEYERIFNEKVENNNFFVLLNGADLNNLSKDITAISDKIVIEKSDHYKLKLEAGLKLYDIVSIVLVAIAIAMSFMILTNLSNIYITRKKKELIVMRINGFSIKQTINYLAKETILTTLIGIILAVIAGYFFTSFVIKFLEQPDAQFVREFSISSWIIAILLEALFSFIINYSVFRKVKDLNFREIQ